MSEHRDPARAMRWQVLVGLLVVGALSGVSGCVGPRAIGTTRLKYNQVYNKTTQEQLLLNIVRMRYADTPTIIDLPNITGQYEAGAVGGFNSPFDTLDPGVPNFGAGQLTYRDTPTLSFHPRGGHEISQTLVNPLTAEVLRVISPGSDTRHFLLMAVSEINDIQNAPLATSLVPRFPQENASFREAVDLFVSIQERGAIELRIATYDDEDEGPLPLSQVTGQDMIMAAKEGYRFQVRGDEAILRKREKSVVLRVRPSEMNAPDVQEMIARLGLRPGLGLYKVRAEQSEEEETDALAPEPLGSDTILANMRSILDIMVFLSKGVRVPPEHIACGIAPVTPGPNGVAHDWCDITRGLIAIRSQKLRPIHAEIAVPYRGHWFYIDRTDITSRSTMSILSLLLEIQEVERDQRAPLLTLPL
jgi:hypothetical protein